jgi:outer membrane protein assembly factor BamA
MFSYGKIILLAAGLAFASSFLFAQKKSSDSLAVISLPTPPDSTIETGISNGDVIRINQIQIVGNKVTKRHVILREIPFREGDTIRKSETGVKLKSAKENLLNISLFNFVTVDTVPSGNHQVNVLVTVAERWYTWPVPIFEVQERNFNDWWERKDFARANYGFYLNRENFRGRKEELSFYAQFGYTVKYGIAYDIPYLTHKQTGGLGFSFSYGHNHEIAYMTSDNHQLYFKDPNDYVRKEYVGKLKYFYRKGIHNSQYFEAKYVNALVNDTVRFITVDYFEKNKMEMKFFGLDYSIRTDFRDSRQYPLKGYFFEFEITKLGLGILKEEKMEVTNFYLTVRGYEKLSNRFYVSAGGKAKLSPTKDQPYYVQRGMGWSDYVRGYEYYVIDGQQYGTAKFGLKYEIVKPRIQKIPLPFNKFNTFHYAFYANIFGDAGYVDDHLYSGANPLANTFLYGYGVGIDYVTYYDIILRLECSMNKMKELGFFVHFNAGI